LHGWGKAVLDALGDPAKTRRLLIIRVAFAFASVIPFVIMALVWAYLV